MLWLFLREERVLCALVLLVTSASFARNALAQSQIGDSVAIEASDSARAQDSSATPSTETPPAPLPAVESPETRSARELTLRAHERFDAGDYEAALAEFSRAYEVLKDAQRRAALLNNIAVCHERLFHYDLALQYYARYLREAAADSADRAEVEAIIRALRGLLGKLHITSNVRAQIWIDDRPLGFAPGDVEIPAGTRVVKLQASGRQDVQRQLTVVARTTQTVHFELVPLPTYHGLAPTYFWAGVGLTAAAAVTGAGLGIAALRKHRENQSLRREQLLQLPAEQQKRNLTIATDISFGIAALFAVGSTVLFFLSDFHGGDGTKSGTDRRVNLWLLPSVAKGSMQLQLARVFP